MLTRRQLIKTGMAGSVVLLVSGLLATPQADWPAAADPALHFLLPADAQILRSIAPVMLGRSGLPLDDVIRGVDLAIANLLPSTRKELRQLFDLLANRWARRWLAGVRSPWAQAQAGEIAAFLQGWQNSPFLLLRSGYQALHALINAAWFGNPASWSTMAYQQPPYIMSLLP